MNTLRCYEVELLDEQQNIFTGIVVINNSIFNWANENHFVVKELLGWLPAQPSQRTKLNKKVNCISGFRPRAGVQNFRSSAKIVNG